MPELPDITVYLEALARSVAGQRLARVQLRSLFVLRTSRPPIETLVGREVVELRRMGKRIVIGFGDDLWLVLHLMVAGRLQWLPREGRAKPPAGKIVLALFEFESGTLVLTEAGTKKRAALHVIAGEAALAAHDPGGLEVMTASPEAFAQVLTAHNHTLKRALTAPHLFSGIGNAYSDEILQAARLSPVKLTSRLSAEEIERMHAAVRTTLETWTNRLRTEAGNGFPKKVTAFRPEMAVHGKFGQACPTCGTAVQRIRYAENETNYCPGCQTEGRILADRSLSRLLKNDWPRTVEAWETARGSGQKR